jgi:hypothetical protein
MTASPHCVIDIIADLEADAREHNTSAAASIEAAVTLRRLYKIPVLQPPPAKPVTFPTVAMDDVRRAVLHAIGTGSLSAYRLSAALPHYRARGVLRKALTQLRNEGAITTTGARSATVYTAVPRG